MGHVGHVLICSLAFASTVAGDIKPLVIGHRGASGYRPEHTLASYQLAIEMGADYIEPDLVMTKDGVLVARHENEISGTTDVADKFPSRKTTKMVDGEKITGWFVEDFTLKEIKSLRARERLEFRNHSFDGKFEIPTFVEILKLLQNENKKRKTPVGIYPETKHPTYFEGIGLPLEKALVKDLKKFAMNKKTSPVFIQSFELGSLKKIHKLSPLPSILLIDDLDKRPFDFIKANVKQTYRDLIQPESLKKLKKIISGIGPDKRFIIPLNAEGKKLPATNLITQAHAAGLLVHVYTFRSDESFLLKEYQKDSSKEYFEFFDLGVDGVFSDFADQAVKAREAWVKKSLFKK